MFYQTGKLREPRSDLIASYEHLERDIAALKYLKVTHYRFGIEWARIEPAPGQFRDDVIQHYADFARRLTEEGITPVLCLWHFTFPNWLSDMKNARRHGWLHPDTPAAWARYVRRVVPAFKPFVKLYAPQNEPNAYALGVTAGVLPPGIGKGERYFDELTAAEVTQFLKAAAIIRELHPEAKIISIQNVMHWHRDPLDTFGTWLKKARDYNHRHLDGIVGALDYLGFNYYQGEIASPLAIIAQRLRSGRDVTDLGWVIDPNGLEREIVDLAHRYHKPLVIMENGIADSTDAKRPGYLFNHLWAIHRAREAGYDVRGYFHWSLMDNYEWVHGYEKKFGLFAVDRGTKSLVPKATAELFEFFAGNDFMKTASPPKRVSILPDATQPSARQAASSPGQ